MAFGGTDDKPPVHGRPAARRPHRLPALSRFALFFLTMIVLAAAGSVAFRILLAIVTLD